jgi:formylglycine-generating enzyme required for sulfatase activity
MKFSWIPAGTFLMGNPEDEDGRYGHEPQHQLQVTLTKGVYLGIHPVTQAVWQAVMGNNPSKFQGDALPVEPVSWDDCQEFLRKVCEKEGPGYQLPTEAQWEYACRAGTTTAYYFGDTISKEQVNYGNSPPSVVGSLPPNAWGLYDMHGNVWEWCADWYDEYPKGEVVDPQGPKSGTSRVFRGGSFYYQASVARSAYRIGMGPAGRDHGFGFRLARTFP